MAFLELLFDKGIFLFHLSLDWFCAGMSLF